MVVHRFCCCRFTGYVLLPCLVLHDSIDSAAKAVSIRMAVDHLPSLRPDLLPHEHDRTEQREQGCSGIAVSIISSSTKMEVEHLPSLRPDLPPHEHHRTKQCEQGYGGIAVSIYFRLLSASQERCRTPAKFTP